MGRVSRHVTRRSNLIAVRGPHIGLLSQGSERVTRHSETVQRARPARGKLPILRLNGFRLPLSSSSCSQAHTVSRLMWAGSKDCRKNNFTLADRQMWRTHSCVPRRHSCRRLTGGAPRQQLRSYYCVNPKDSFGSPADRKSTRLNSSHLGISYAVFCLKKKNK